MFLIKKKKFRLNSTLIDLKLKYQMTRHYFSKYANNLFKGTCLLINIQLYMESSSLGWRINSSGPVRRLKIIAWRTRLNFHVKTREEEKSACEREECWSIGTTVKSNYLASRKYSEHASLRVILQIRDATPRRDAPWICATDWDFIDHLSITANKE